MPKQLGEPAFFFTGGLREYLSRIYHGAWVGVQLDDPSVPAFLMRVGQSPDGEHLVCTALVIADEIAPDADLAEPSLPITSTALREVKVPAILDYLERHPRLGFDRALPVREPERHPGRAGYDDAFYRQWAADYRKLRKRLRRRPSWRDFEPPMKRSTFFRLRKHAIGLRYLKENE